MMYKKQCMLSAMALVAGTALAEVTHVSESKGLRIPQGTFTQFRLAGEGLNDDNLQADITQTEHQMTVKGAPQSSKFGLMTDTKFDVFVFESETDYNCYIEASTMWLEHGIAQQCEFVGNKPDVVFEQVEEWSSQDNVFLSKDKTHNDVFVVLDNTGWLQQVSNSLPKQVYHDVTYEMTIETKFKANDLYDKMFLGFMATLAILFATIILMACLYRLQKRAHSQVMQTKKELKRITLAKQYRDENRRDEDSSRQGTSSVLLQETSTNLDE